MKTLLLLRHAKSSWDQPELADHDRPLNTRGKQESPQMGKLAEQLGLVPDIIISSTAKRTRKTAKKFAKGCGFDGEILYDNALYDTGPDDYAAVVKHHADPHDRAMVIGHNPTLEEVVYLLTRQRQALPTASLVHIELDIHQWADLSLDGRARLIKVWRPRDLK